MKIFFSPNFNLKHFVLYNFKPLLFCLLFNSLLLAFFFIWLQSSMFLYILHLVFKKGWDPALVFVIQLSLGLFLTTLLFMGDLAFIVLYILGFSLFHLVFLRFFPYLENSPYYLYLSSFKSFESNFTKYPSLFSDKQLVFVRMGIFFFFYVGVSNFGQETDLPFLIVVGLCLVYLLDCTIKIVNIVQRPAMPIYLIKAHPVVSLFPHHFQRRHMAFFNFVLNKVLPMCAQVGPVVVSTYLTGAGAYKLINGISSVDPIRQALLSKYHGFPPTFEWTEATLEAWRRYKNSAAIIGKTDAEAIESFIQHHRELREKTALLIQGIEQMPPSKKDELLKQMSSDVGVELKLRRRKTD